MTFFATPSKRAAVFAVLFLLASVPSFAQLIITSDQFANALSQLAAPQNTYNDTNTVGLQALINQTGANQTWSFQSLPPFVEDTTDNSNSGAFVAYSPSFPEADSFPTATHVDTFSSGGNKLYIFYRIDQSGFYSLGISADSMGTPIIVQTWTPAEENFAFPLTYQTQWSSTSVINNPPYSSNTEEIDGFVDAWGTYSVPGNNSIQALRIRTKTTDNYPATIYSTPDGKDTIPAYSDTSYSFEWFNLSNFSAHIDADANQNATRADYNTPSSTNLVSGNNTTSSYSVSIASNPISSSTNISFLLPGEAQVRISLMDALGKQSQVLMNGMAHSGMNMLTLDPANLMNGTYFLRMESGGNSSMQKVIVNH